MWNKALRVTGVTAAAISMATAVAAPTGAQPDGLWTGAWATAQQQPNKVQPAEWSLAGFADQSVRQVIRVSTAGAGVRVRLSNAYGTKPLRIAGATVARTAEGAGVEAASMRPLLFGARDEFVIPPGGELASDLVSLPVSALDELTVTLYFDEPTGPANNHGFANVTSYRSAGDHRFDLGGKAFTDTSTSWYFLAGVDVLGDPSGDSVVTFGDSITDGAGATFAADNRYPDQLAERLVEAGRSLGVLNTGIGGNRLLNDSPCFGEKATARFQRDVLDQPDVRSVIILEGINDIGFSEKTNYPCAEPNPEVTAAQLISVHQELIRRAHARGIRAIGATLLPFEGADYFTERGEAVRQKVNEWIRTSGTYDAVVDFDRALADPANPRRLAPEYDSGDRLHPSDAGYQAMADAIDLRQL